MRSEIDLAVQVIVFMLDHPGVEILGDEIEFIAVAIQRGDVDVFVTRHLAAQIGNAEATFPVCLPCHPTAA